MGSQDQDTDREFRTRVDAFIRLANELRADADNERVNASLFYAAARFSAFIVASLSQDAREMRKDREEAIRCFSDQYQWMLTENLDDYLAHYDEYVLKFREP